MKKLINTLILVVGIAGFTFAQDANTAKSNGAKALSASKTSGVYELTMPAEVTADKVEQSSKYYTHYFTVSFDDKSNVATITMAQNDSKSRYVISRFLAACGVLNVIIDDKTVKSSEFAEDYLK
jgi:hypothetical protein